MNILAINGSHRGKNGLTHILIEKLLEGAKDAGANCNNITLSEKTIIPCKGCSFCQTEKSYLKCMFNEKDDANELIDMVRNADLLVYATPVYVFTISSLLKKFLERLISTSDSSIRSLSDDGLIFHHIDTKVFSKPIVILVCQDNFENETNKNVIEYFKSFSKFCNASIVGTLIRKNGLLFRQLMEQKNQNVTNILEEYFKAGQELAINGKILVSTQKKANVNILPIPKMITFLLKFNFIRKNRKLMLKILEKSKIKE